MQQAYFSESNMAGGWQLIGYQAPGSSGKTTNFTYSGVVNANGTTTADTEDAWKAAANVALNDCPSGSTWDIKAKMNAAKGTVSFDATLGAESKCLTLTPNFKLIGK